MKKVLVIGGTGALGSRVALRLADTTQAEVLILTRDPGSAQARGLTARSGAASNR